MSVDIEDMTRKPPTADNIAEAIAVVHKFRTDMKFIMSYPELAVNLGNIARCLDELRKVRGL